MDDDDADGEGRREMLWSGLDNEWTEKEGQTWRNCIV